MPPQPRGYQNVLTRSWLKELLGIRTPIQILPDFLFLDFPLPFMLHS